MTDQQAILIFMTTQAALQAEDALLDGGLDIDVIPRPPGLRGLCGIALVLRVSGLEAAARILDEQDIPFAVYDEAAVAPDPSRVYTAGSAPRGEAAAGRSPDNCILTPAPAERPGPHESEGGEPN